MCWTWISHSECLPSLPIRGDPLLWNLEFYVSELYPKQTHPNSGKLLIELWGAVSRHHPASICSTEVPVLKSNERLSDWTLHLWHDACVNLLRLPSWLIYFGSRVYWNGSFNPGEREKNPNKIKLLLCPLLDRLDSAEAQTGQTVLQSNKKPGEVRDCVTLSMPTMPS